MSRNHARRLDAREPQHLDPNWYTFRRFSAWETAERRSESSPEPSLPHRWAGMTRIARVGRCLHPTAHQVRTTPLTAGRTDLGETGEQMSTDDRSVCRAVTISSATTAAQIQPTCTTSARGLLDDDWR
jgi:hypothetical protein